MANAAQAMETSEITREKYGMRSGRLRGYLAGAGALLLSGTAFADGPPHNWQIGFQAAASPVKEQMDSFHDLLLVIIIALTVFVLGLLVYVMWRFSAARNPVPSKTAHNTVIEVIWTIAPVLILLVIVVPSFRLLYFGDRTPNPEMTLIAHGYQWYWGYEYPDQKIAEYTSYMVQDADLKPDQVRMLSVDNPVVLPVDTNIQILTTGGDVIHSWAIPAFGVKKDAVPGRTNETWVRIDKPGVYYGQCSQLCGTDHAFMPIEVHAVSREDFDKWVVQKVGQAGLNPADRPKLLTMTWDQAVARTRLAQAGQ
jgi:cytochrome c oxidase subunit II